MALIWQEQFNSDLSGWSITGNPTITTVDYSPKCYIDSNDAIKKSIAISTTRFIIETDLYYTSDAGLDGRFEVLDSGANVIISAQLYDGNIIVDTDDDTSSTTTFAHSVYRQLIIVVDTSAATASFYLSDADGTYGDWDIIGAAKSYTGATLTHINIRNTVAGVVRVDNVTVYNPTVFITGDSISDGKYLWSANPSWEGRVAFYEDETSPPSVQLGTLISDHVANRGFGGSSSDEIDAQIQEILLDHHPSIVIIHIGHNDFSTGANTVEEAQGYVTSVINKCLAAGIVSTNIILCKVAPSYLFDGAPAGDETNRILYNRWVSTTAQQRWLRLAYNCEWLSDPAVTGTYKALLTAYAYSDYIHLNKTGSGILAKAIANSVILGGTLRSGSENLVPASFIEEDEAAVVWGSWPGLTSAGGLVLLSNVCMSNVVMGATS